MAIIFYKSKHAGVCFDKYSPTFVKQHPKFLFVFGDNTQRIGLGGQACIRYEPNSFGIATKVSPSITSEAFFTGTEEELELVKVEFQFLRRDIANGFIPIFPSSGLGTGISQLQVRAPNILEYIDSEVSSLIGTSYKLLRNRK